MGDLTESQRALVRLIGSNKYDLADCTGGYALWRRDIEWSQGRVPSNAISAADIDALMHAGLLSREGSMGYNPYKELRPTFALFRHCHEHEGEKLLAWSPDDGPGVYRGPAFR